MSIIRAGLFSPPSGGFSNVKFHPSRASGALVLPRYHRDAKSPAQIEMRRRFRILISIVSRIYLSHVKPCRIWYGVQYPCHCVVMDINLHSYYEWQSLPYVWLFPSRVRRDFWCSPFYDSVHDVLYFVWAGDPGWIPDGTEVLQWVFVGSPDRRIIPDPGYIDYTDPWMAYPGWAAVGAGWVYVHVSVLRQWPGGFRYPVACCAYIMYT